MPQTYPTRLLLLCVVSIFLVCSAAAQAPQQPGFADVILGRWDLTVQGPEGPYPSWLEITLRKETELMGRFVGRFGSTRHLAQVDFRDGELLIRVPVQYEKNSSDQIFKGKLVGDKLTGSTEDEGGKTLTWTGVRAPDLARPEATTMKWGQPVQLFNGKDLTGWKLRTNDKGNCWNVANGTLVNNVPCVDLITEQQFTDFRLHAEFNIVEKSNSGIYLRGRYEVQIQDDVKKAIDSLRMGGMYGYLRPSANAAKGPGEWQTYDITLVGRRVTIVLNGQTVVDHAEIPGITGGALDSAEGTPGPLMLQGDHGKIAFRNIVITPAAQ